MDSKHLLGFYQAMKNLPDAEARLASAVSEYLLSNTASNEILDTLNELHENLNSCSTINNMDLLFMQESKGKLADLSMSISSFFADEESASRPLFLLANLKVACTLRGSTNAVELISAIEKHLSTESPNKIPTLKSLAVLESLIEDPLQNRSVYEEIYTILNGEPGPSDALKKQHYSDHDDTDEHETMRGLSLSDEYINPFMRSETANQNVLEQRILIVDDEKMIAATVGFILSDLDLPIDIVSDGAAALDRLNEYPYSLVISDIEMPNFDGFSLIGAMRNDFQFSDVPLVFMSNKEDYRELALELGANDFFLKGSIGGEELLEKISIILKTAPFVPQRDDD